MKHHLREQTISKMPVKRTLAKLGNKLGLIRDDVVYKSGQEYFKELLCFSKKELARKLIIIANKLEGYEEELVSDSYYQELREQSKRTLARALVLLTEQYQKTPMWKKEKAKKIEQKHIDFAKETIIKTNNEIKQEATT